MTLEQLQSIWMAVLGFLRLRFTVPAALVTVLLVQTIYWTLLRARVGGGRRRRRREPSEPIMPTKPGESITYAAGAGDRLGSGEGTPQLGVAGVVEEPRMVILNGLPNVTDIRMPQNKAEFGVGRFYNEEHDILIALDERSISRRHARIRMDNANREYFVWDTSSSYGTSIRRGDTFEALTPGNEERVYNGDVIKFGSAVTVRLVLPGDTRAYATQI